MFRYHTSQFGSCASEIHKTLCYFFAAVNIFLALDILADSSTVWFEVFDESREANDSQVLGDLLHMGIFFTIVGPVLANVILAVMLIIGVYKRRPNLIRVFKLFIIAQMITICFVSLFSFKIVLEHKGSYTIMLFVLVISTALFGAEAWIAGDYYKILQEEIRHESLDPSTVRIA